MPWWLALLVYALGAAVLIAVVVLVAAIALAAGLLCGLALGIDWAVAGIRRRPRRLGVGATASGGDHGDDRDDPPRGRSYYY